MFQGFRFSKIQAISSWMYKQFVCICLFLLCLFVFCLLLVSLVHYFMFHFLSISFSYFCSIYWKLKKYSLFMHTVANYFASNGPKGPGNHHSSFFPKRNLIFLTCLQHSGKNTIKHFMDFGRLFFNIHKMFWPMEQIGRINCGVFGGIFGSTFSTFLSLLILH